MYEWGNNDLQLLSQLLNPKSEQTDEPNEDGSTSGLYKSERLNENNAYVKVENNSYEGSKNHINEDTGVPEAKLSKNKCCIDDELFDEDTFLHQEETEKTSNWKQTPKFDISYKQTVTPSEIYLQFGGKNPSTSSCENMVVKVHLPGQSLKNIVLNVTKNKVEISSPTFYLDLPLPQPVDPQKGNAAFDACTEDLIINLFMKREFDYINF